MIDFVALKTANAPLHAFLDWDEGAAFGDGPLAGLTVGVKANIMTKGLPWTGGLAAFCDRIAARDADCVARLRGAGAAILGTLNMEEAALGAKTDSPHYGRTQNPHRLGWSPGGSSGGSGAAVAAGLCDIALGTDTMGSVRIPAAHCGVYGFKPATRRVSQDGLEAADLALDAIGPLARNLDLLERAAALISQVGTTAPTAGAGCTLIDHGVDLHPAVARAFAAACAALPLRPATVVLDHPPGRVRFAGFIQVSRTMATHLADVPDLSPHLAKLLTYGPRRSDADWAVDASVLAATRAQLRDFVATHGFLILPTCPNPAFSHDDPEPAAQADFTCLANVAGLPALALPAGWTDDGLPVGVQLVGGEGEEGALFALARRIDSTLRAYRAP